MSIKIGDQLPEATFRVLGPEGQTALHHGGVFGQESRAVRGARGLHPNL